MKKTIIQIAIFIFFYNCFANAQSIQGLWVVRDMLKSKSSIDEIVDYAVENKIDFLFVQVRGRGTVYYKSKYEDFATPEIDFDPLEYILKKCENTDVKIHAWFNLYLIWSKVEPPESANHPLNKFHLFLHHLF